MLIYAIGDSVDRSSFGRSLVIYDLIRTILNHISNTYTILFRNVRYDSDVCTSLKFLRDLPIFILSLLRFDEITSAIIDIGNDKQPVYSNVEVNNEKKCYN